MWAIRADQDSVLAHEIDYAVSFLSSGIAIAHQLNSEMQPGAAHVTN